MRERKNVKFRVDMLSDTKFKIIDTKPERDLIHYVWMALVLLAGKVDFAGELYLSKNIPYTLETLAIEFGREIEQVKLALKVLIELEMVELTEHNVYKVKNFAKHQNIKVKEEEKLKDNKENTKNEDTEAKKEIINKALKIKEDKDQTIVKKEENPNVTNLVNIDSSINQIQESTKYQTIDNNPNNDNIYDNDNRKDNTVFEKEEINPGRANNLPIPLERQKSKKTTKKKNHTIDVTEEEIDEEPLLQMFHGDEEIPLKEGDRLIAHWHF